jgi:ADP-dependent NAD(P)H-hydrate dehydratase / NAD(P)H-hydrate epimerase
VRELVRVVTSSESAARDASAVAAGVPSRALMQRAGAAAAGEIALRFRDRLAGGVLVLAGPGNNGGDAWVVARALAAVGTKIRVVEPVPAKSSDAIAERGLALEMANVRHVRPDELPADSLDGGESVVVDGLLGTGASGAPRGALAGAIERLSPLRTRGAVVVALDLPSGVDASTGATASPFVVADLTVAFGTIKRGHLAARDNCGAIVVVDIGLAGHAGLADGAPELVDERWVGATLPSFPADAHKGTRKKLAIVGGAGGMAGAAVLAARAAMRSGAGMVKLVVARESPPAVQEAEPGALAAAWPVDDAALDRDLLSWADAVVVGPGFGRDASSRALLERLLRAWKGPTLLDADAITLFEGRVPDLAALIGDRAALLTPHVVEFARLTALTAADVLARRFDIASDTAAALGATVLLKGVPTVITASDGRRLVSAAGTPALATGGSGDLLSGIAGTLLAQLGDPFVAGAIGAWVHGRAAERVPSSGGDGVRGIALDDVVAELRDAWTFDMRPLRYPVLVELPAVGGRAL